VRILAELKLYVEAQPALRDLTTIDFADAP
jgi:hypothetical protein